MKIGKLGVIFFNYRDVKLPFRPVATKNGVLGGYEFYSNCSFIVEQEIKTSINSQPEGDP